MHRPAMAAPVVPRPPWCPTPGTETYDNPPTCYSMGYVVKTRKNNSYYYLLDYYVHNASTTMMRGYRQQSPQTCMDPLWCFQCNRSVLWTYWHCYVARFPQWRRERRSKYGWRGGNLGVSTMIDLLRHQYWQRASACQIWCSHRHFDA